jgi:hypothetical protein
VDASATNESEEDDGLNLESLPVIAFAEVAKHKSPDDIWVTYEGLVYVAHLLLSLFLALACVRAARTYTHTHTHTHIDTT